MDIAVIIALAVIVPIVLLPAAVVWYMNLNGIRASLSEARKRRVALKNKVKEAVKAD